MKKRQFWFLTILTCFYLAGCGQVNTKLHTWHVSQTGSDTDDGSTERPLRTITAASAKAFPGDTILVHEGIYREQVRPVRGGTSGDLRIVYQVAEGEHVVIKGSEQIKGWRWIEDNAWMVSLPNTFFGDYNPYNDLIQGAWYEARQAWHTGSVYLNGEWLTEAARKGIVVKSENPVRVEGARAELMNISFIKTQAGNQLATEFVDGSETVKIKELSDGKKYLGSIEDQSFLVYNLDFGDLSKNLSINAASPVAGGLVEVRLDDINGQLIGTVNVGFTAEWTHFQTFHCNLTPTGGIHTVYLVFKSRPVTDPDSEKEKDFWYAEVDSDSTRIWANFRCKDPNQEMVEINVRKTVFYPEKEGVNYITIKGFTLEQAGTGWSAPTAEQPGIVGTHWSKGWIIEDNTIRYSACTGLTLGKYGDEFDHTYDFNFTTIPNAERHGWKRDSIGHHLVKDNHIYNCGQGGIEGSLGCSFSTITGNVIHDIRKHRKYGGCETAGIKLHGFVDGVISHNHIYNCDRWGGIWLDWMAQGARISSNLLHDNTQDLMFEVNHGPFLVDNNILLSAKSLTDASGGAAFVHNLISGDIDIWSDLRVRKTPFFKPHTLEIAGRIDVDQNDDRFYNNIFTGGNGTAVYNKYDIKIQAAGNVFLMNTHCSENDINPLLFAKFNPEIELVSKGEEWWIQIHQGIKFQHHKQRSLVNTLLLGNSSVTGTVFENRDGSPYELDSDYFGKPVNKGNPVPGPFVLQDEDPVSFKVWPKF